MLAGNTPSFLQRLELTALDVKFLWRSPRTPEDWRVAIAAIDEKAIRRFGPLPWPRSIHARVVERLTQMRAGSVAFDMTFEQPTALPGRAWAPQVERRIREGRLGATQEALDRTAAGINRIARCLRRHRSPRVLQRYASKLSEAATAVRKQSGRLAAST